MMKSLQKNQLKILEIDKSEEISENSDQRSGPKFSLVDIKEEYIEVAESDEEKEIIQIDESYEEQIDPIIKEDNDSSADEEVNKSNEAEEKGDSSDPTDNLPSENDMIEKLYEKLISHTTTKKDIKNFPIFNFVGYSEFYQYNILLTLF